MRIQQSFTFFPIFILIFSFRLQADSLNHFSSGRGASFVFYLSDTLPPTDIGKIENAELADCSPEKKYCIGIIRYKDGSFYNGEISYGTPNGKGIMKWPDGSFYIGAFVKGERNGYGEFHFNNGNRYEGAWDNNHMNGYGAFIWANGTEYFGDFKDNKMHGSGSVVLKNNEGYSGEWSNNLPDGQGSFKLNNGSTYIGAVKDGLRDGEGKIIWENGDTIFGNWAAGKFNGDVKFLFKNGDQLLTEWVDGQIAFQSSYISTNGKLTKGDLKGIEKSLLFDGFENDLASNIQLTYYLIGLEYDTNFQYEKASEYFQMASNIENDDEKMEESIYKSISGLKEKQNSGWVKLNNQKE